MSFVIKKINTLLSPETGESKPEYYRGSKLGVSWVLNLGVATIFDDENTAKQVASGLLQSEPDLKPNENEPDKVLQVVKLSKNGEEENSSIQIKESAGETTISVSDLSKILTTFAIHSQKWSKQEVKNILDKAVSKKYDELFDLKSLNNTSKKLKELPEKDLIEILQNLSKINTWLETHPEDDLGDGSGFYKG